MAIYHPPTGYEPNVIDDFHYSETSVMIFQDESSDIGENEGRCRLETSVHCSVKCNVWRLKSKSEI